MQELILKKTYFLNNEFNKKDSVIIYTILFALITRYFVWYNNKGKHPGTGNDTVKERLTLKKLDAKIDKLAEKVDILANTLNQFITEQREFNQYVLDVFERNNLK